MGVLIIRGPLLRVYAWAPDFWKLPFGLLAKDIVIVASHSCGILLSASRYVDAQGHA